MAIATFLVKNMMSALMLAIGLFTATAVLRATWASITSCGGRSWALELSVPLLALPRGCPALQLQPSGISLMPTSSAP